MDKRTFLKTAGLIGKGGMLNLDGLAQMVNSVASVPSTKIAGDENSGHPYPKATG